MKVIIQKLSKSSPYAVATPKSKKDVFDYLHIETNIEREYIATLENLKEKRVIFLCGSSGDGKSAIITRSQNRFEGSCEFHLDATHSFNPNESAFERLDKVFDNHEESKKSLVVGINIGILINYSKYNEAHHSSLKNILKEYLSQYQKELGEISFINFEEYPKFESAKSGISSKFLKEIFQKITISSEDNPFYQAYINGKDKKTILCKNYELLSMENVQDKIIELIVLTHLKYNQFLTARSILDLIYTLLSEDKLLIDVLFENRTNSIIKNIRYEDPCLKRSETIDRFIIKQTNREVDKELHLFLKDLDIQNLNPDTMLRLFYLLGNVEQYNVPRKTNHLIEHSYII
jgi:DNA phosphorothioation-dependent restriction protein DptF